MADRQITCTIKAGGIAAPRDTYITHVGGLFGIITEDQAIYDIEHRINTYHTFQGGRRAEVQVIQGQHRKFLKTETDFYTPNNLLSLPHCP